MDRGAGWDLYLYCKGEIVTFIILILYMRKLKHMRGETEDIMGLFMSYWQQYVNFSN